MDYDAQVALTRHCRRALAAEIAEVTRLADVVDQLTRQSTIGDLHKRLVAVEQRVGLTPRPLGQAARRDRVAELHAAGLSDRLIARVLAANRSTIMSDRQSLGLAPSPDAVGLDGMRLGERSANGTRNGNGRANGNGY